MRKPSSSSKYVIAALVAAAFGLTAGAALAQTTPPSEPGNTAAGHRHASKKSVRDLSSQVKHEREQMQATTGKLNHATTELNHTAQHMQEAQSSETRVASAEHHMRNEERKVRSHVHTRKHHPASTTPPPR